MTKKLFWIVIKISFSITNSNNQELIHHAYCLGYVFYHYYVKARQRNVVNSIGSYSAIFTVDSIIEFFKHLSFKKIYLYSQRLILATTILLTSFGILCLLLSSTKNKYPQHKQLKKILKKKIERFIASINAFSLMCSVSKRNTSILETVSIWSNSYCSAVFNTHIFFDIVVCWLYMGRTSTQF